MTHLPASATICALSITRTTTELAPSSKIVCAAAFTATDDTLSTRFDTRMATVPPACSREQALAHVAQLVPLGAMVIVRNPRMPRGLVRQLTAGRPMPNPTDAQALRALRCDLNVRAVNLPEQTLDWAAQYFGLYRASAADLIAERARRSEEEAQALFLAHLFSAVSEQDRVRLAAGYQAWSALRKAAPFRAFGTTEEF